MNDRHNASARFRVSSEDMLDSSAACLGWAGVGHSETRRSIAPFSHLWCRITAHGSPSNLAAGKGFAMGGPSYSGLLLLFRYMRGRSFVRDFTRTHNPAAGGWRGPGGE